MSEDILERAKDAAENIDHYAYDCDFEEARLVILALIPEVERLRADQDAIMAAWDKDAVEKDARVQELEAERERLQSNWRQEHATAEIWKEDFRKMKKALQESELLRQAQYNQITANNARIKELEAEVEAKNKQIKELQDIIDKPPEDADWVADYHLLQSALDGPIIDAARKWHAAYRKAQNSNLMRAKEVERLRSPEISGDLKKKIRMIRHCLHNPHSKQQGIDAFNAAGELARLLAAKDARIKELEEMIRQLGSLAFMGDMPLDQIVAHFIAWGQSNYDYTSLLEAAFLDSLAARLYYEHYPGVSDAYSWHDYPEDACHCMPKEKFREKAREALERIKGGRKG